MAPLPVLRDSVVPVLDAHDPQHRPSIEVPLDVVQQQDAKLLPLYEYHTDNRVPLTAKAHWRAHRIGIALLFVLWLFHGAANFWWLKVDTRPPFSDTAGHAIQTLRLASLSWREILVDGPFLEEILQIGPYPPLFYLTSLPFADYLWPTVDAMLGVNMLYVGLLIFSTYAIARRIAGEYAAVLAAFLVSMYPVIFGLSRVYLLDVALTAMTTFAFFCLLWSESFRHSWRSLLLGVAIGLAMLTKWTFIAFFTGPLAIALYTALRYPAPRRLINIAVAGLTSLLVALPWYLYNFASLQQFLHHNGLLAAQLENDPAVLSFASFAYYPLALVQEQILFPFFLLFLTGTLLALRRVKLNSDLLMLLAWLVVGYVASSLFINKDPRYTMPYLPAFALLSAIGLMQIRRLAIQRGLLALIILYALVQFAGLTVGLRHTLGWMPNYIGWPPERGYLTLYTERVHMADRARADNWQIDAIVKTILDDARSHLAHERPVQLVVVPTAPYFDAQAFSYVKWRDRLNLEVGIVTGILKVDSKEVLKRSDYVVIKSGEQGWEFARQDAGEITAQLMDPASAMRAEYELLAEFPLPDNSTAQLFRHLHAQAASD